jgi:hypothetical protein
VWTLDQMNYWLKQGLWPIAGNIAPDPYFEYVTMLLPGNGTNGAQNNTFLDSSTNNFTITRNGNTTQGTFSPFGSNWSNSSFSGSAYLTYNPGATAAFGTGDFTVEAWVFATEALSSGDNPYICDTRGGGGAWSFSWNWTGSANPWQLAWANSSALQSSTSMPLNTWNHCAYVRSGTTGTLYLNGVSIGTWTDSYNYSSSVTSITIGRRFTTTGQTQWLPGYLSNLRIVKGTAVYTGAFTPPTSPLTAITNTVLLTCQSNRFIDNSSNAFAITVNGSPSVQRFSPFNPTAPYAAGTDGGSGYFDGSGDSLTTSSLPSFNGDFDIEFWVYSTAISTPFYLYRSGDAYPLVSIQVSFSSALRADVSTDGATSTTLTHQSTAVAGQWNHVALTRSGTTVRLFLNGVVSSSTITVSGAISTTSAVTYLGTGAALLTGYLSNLRVVQGSAVYTSSFTPPSSPVTAITNTSLLLNFTNAGIIDNAEMNNLETVGNAQISTAQSKFGGASMYFDGSGDALALPANINLAMGSGDFTIEMWVYAALASNSTTVGGSWPRFFTLGTAQGSGNINSYVASGATVYIDIDGAGGPLSFTASTLLNSTWNHYAITRSGTTLKAFVNGTQVASSTASNNLNLAATTQSWIGAISSSAGTFNGYIDDLRITKGVARYTANFTAPTAAFPLF